MFCYICERSKINFEKYRKSLKGKKCIKHGDIIKLAQKMLTRKKVRKICAIFFTDKLLQTDTIRG